MRSTQNVDQSIPKKGSVCFGSPNILCYKTRQDKTRQDKTTVAVLLLFLRKKKRRGKKKRNERDEKRKRKTEGKRENSIYI
jgi:hypothetical protein